MKFNSLLITLVSVAFAASSFAGVTAGSGKACTTCAPIAAEGLFDTVGATVTVGYDSNYVYRGFNIGENLVSGSIDLPIAINKQWTLDLNAWYGALDSATPGFGGGDYGELDLTASLLYKFEAFTVGLKYEHYFFFMDAHHALSDIDELGLTLATSIGGGVVDLAAYVGYDFTADGWYYEASASHTFKINDWLSIVPGVLISFGTDYYGVDGGETIKPSVAFPIKLTKTATLTPYIAGNIPFDSLHSNGEDARVYGGISLSVTF